MTFSALAYDHALPSPVCQATLSSAGGHLLFANPADSGEGFASARMQGTIKKSVDHGKTWSSELHVTPMGLTPTKGGSYDYSCLLPEPLKDDPTQGGLLWSHHSVENGTHGYTPQLDYQGKFWRMACGRDATP